MGRLDGNMGVRTMLGQNHFLRSFHAARSDGLADGTSDEALRVHSIQTDSEQTANGQRTVLSGFSTGVLNCITFGRSMNPVRTLVVVWLFSFYFAHEH
jgi:hypothetical protein